MKFVINTCAGGFGLSIDAIVFLMEKNSELVISLPFAEQNFDARLLNNSTEFNFLGKPGLYGAQYSTVYDTKDGGTVNFIGISEELVDKLGVMTCDLRFRSHPDLIEVVETLGDKASGFLSKLKVVEINDPKLTIDDVYLQENLGSESIHEVSRVWK